MLNQPLTFLGQHIAAIISHLGYAGIVLLMGIESACIPLPSEIILPFSGFLAATGRFHLWAVALAGAVGCNLGSAVAYAVGYWGGRGMAHRYGRRLLISPRDLTRAESWFERRGEITILVARMLPVVRTFIALPAGVARMPQGKFHLYTFLGSLPWCWLLAYAGERLGANWSRVEPVFHRIHLVVLPLLAAGLAWWIWRHVQSREIAENA